MSEVKKKKLTKAEKMAALDTLLDGLGLKVTGRQLLSLNTLTYATDEQRRSLRKFNFKQKIFIRAYTDSYGNITASCEVAGVHRATYYHWRKTNIEFCSYIDSLQMEEVVNDLNEFAIIRLLKEGNPYAVMGRARMKMRHRGYIDKFDAGTQGSSVENVHWYLPDNGRDSQTTTDVDYTDETEKKADQNNSE